MIAPIVESHRGVLVVRDDLHPGCQSARKSAPGSAPNFDPPFG